MLLGNGLFEGAALIGLTTGFVLHSEAIVDAGNRVVDFRLENTLPLGSNHRNFGV